MGKGMKNRILFSKILLLLGIHCATLGNAYANRAEVIVNPINPTTAVASGVASTSPLQNPNQLTLAQLNQPNDSQLSQANKQLLVQNAELQRKVDSLNTQVNLLVHERSSQLFMYGALVAVICLVLGFALAWLIFGRKKSGW